MKIRRLLSEEKELGIITKGRKSGLENMVTVWFVYEGNYILGMTHARQNGLGTNWYRNLQHNVEAKLCINNYYFSGIFEPIQDSEKEIMLNKIIYLFGKKYGSSLVEEWYKPSDRIPVKLRLVIPNIS